MTRSMRKLGVEAKQLLGYNFRKKNAKNTGKFNNKK